MQTMVAETVTNKEHERKKDPHSKHHTEADSSEDRH